MFDPIDEIEYAHDVQASLGAAMSALKGVKWEVTRRRFPDSEHIGPGWEPFAVSKEVVYYRRPVMLNE